MVGLARGLFADIFLDKTGQVYAYGSIEIGEKEYARMTLGVDSEQFHSLLSWRYYTDYGKVPANDAIKSAISVLKAQAVVCGDSRELSTRYSFDRRTETIMIDTGDKAWRMYEITKQGFSCVEQKHPIFKRHSHMLTLEGGVSETNFREKRKCDRRELRAFCEFFHLHSFEDEVLLSGFIGASMIAHIPHAFLIARGPEGSAKTTLEVALKQIIDPTVPMTLTMNSDEEELVMAIAHHYFVAFDNVSPISKKQEWKTDLFSRSATGAGYMKRAHYTNDEGFVYEFKRVLAFNGLNLPSNQGDFLQRCLVVNMDEIEESERLPDETVREFLEHMIPHVRGAAFNGLVYALNHVNEIKDELRGKLPRLADFAIWAEAFCRGIGYEPNSFHEAFLSKGRESRRAALESDPISLLLIQGLFTDGAIEWEGTATELLKKLSDIDSYSFGGVHAKSLPRSEDSLGIRLGKLVGPLRSQGVKVERVKVTFIDSDGKKKTRGSARNIKITKLGTLDETNKEEPQSNSSDEHPERNRNNVSNVSNVSPEHDPVVHVAYTLEGSSTHADTLAAQRVLPNDTKNEHENGSSTLTHTSDTSVYTSKAQGKSPFAWLCPVCRSAYGSFKVWSDHMQLREKIDVKQPHYLAVEVFKSLSVGADGQNKQPVSIDDYVQCMKSTGKFAEEQAKDRISQMWKNGLIFEVSEGVYKRV